MRVAERGRCERGSPAGPDDRWNRARRRTPETQSQPTTPAKGVSPQEVAIVNELSCGSARAGQASCGARGWEGRCSMARPLPQMLRRPGSTGATDVMPYTTFLAISATIVALVLSACSGSSRSSHPPRRPRLPLLPPIRCSERIRARAPLAGRSQPARDGDHWLCFGYQPRPRAKLSPARGPAAGLALSGARVPGGVVPGGRGGLIMGVPGCHSSHAAIAQPPPTTAGSVTRLLRAPWRVTDRVEISPDAVSGYYEAKLEIVGGAHAGAVGSVPLIVLQIPAAPQSDGCVR